MFGNSNVQSNFPMGGVKVARQVRIRVAEQFPRTLKIQVPKLKDQKLPDNSIRIRTPPFLQFPVLRRHLCTYIMAPIVEEVALLVTRPESHLDSEGVELLSNL